MYELEGYDEIRALLDSKYRFEQEKMRDRKINKTFEVNPRILFPEDEEESESELSVEYEGVQFAADVPDRGDPKKWRIVHESEHLTGFNNCSVCEEQLIFPAPSCQSCLTAYHYECRNQISNICLC